MSCFQFHLAGQDHAQLQSRLAGNTTAVDTEQLKMLETCPELFELLLRIYAGDEVVAEAHTDAVTFLHTSNVTTESFSPHL